MQILGTCTCSILSLFLYISFYLYLSLSIVLIYNYSANVLTHKLAKVPNFFGKEVDGC